MRLRRSRGPRGGCVEEKESEGTDAGWWRKMKRGGGEGEGRDGRLCATSATYNNARFCLLITG